MHIDLLGGFKSWREEYASLTHEGVYTRCLFIYKENITQTNVIFSQIDNSIMFQIYKNCIIICFAILSPKNCNTNLYDVLYRRITIFLEIVIYLLKCININILPTIFINSGALSAYYHGIWQIKTFISSKLFKKF